jgi:hypothetical protein
MAVWTDKNDENVNLEPPTSKTELYPAYPLQVIRQKQLFSFPFDV